MSNYAEHFAMSKYASGADRSAAMLAELEHLAIDLHTERAAVAALRSQMERQKDEWLAWAEKRSALERDAERYRWLRDKARTVDWTKDVNGWSWEQHCRIGARSMDAAIDDARKVTT